MSPKENNKKRINNRGKVPVLYSIVSEPNPVSVASPPPEKLSDSVKIMLERRIAELRAEIPTLAKRGHAKRAMQLYEELVRHQTKREFTPDEPPKIPLAAARKEENSETRTPVSEWPSHTEIKGWINHFQNSVGLPLKK